MVTNHDNSVFDHHPTTTRGFTETVNWALKHAEYASKHHNVATMASTAKVIAGEIIEQSLSNIEH